MKKPTAKDFINSVDKNILRVNSVNTNMNDYNITDDRVEILVEIYILSDIFSRWNNIKKILQSWYIYKKNDYVVSLFILGLQHYIDELEY